jgi:hypothetical protein
VRPTIVANPRTDLAFVSLADHLADGCRSPDELEGRLRSVYPRVTVRARGLSGEPTVWYVYRDGSWTDPARPE